jgi:hypothetical protein
MRLAEAYRSLARPSSALEPSHPLAGISSLCPTKLSERLVAKLVHGIIGPILARMDLRPSTSSLPQCVHFNWTCWDSDPGPPPCKGGALPAELQARVLAPANNQNSWLIGSLFGLGRHFQLATTKIVAPPAPDGPGRPTGTGWV